LLPAQIRLHPAALRWLQTEGLAPAGPGKKGVFVTGRLNDFELTGERGTKCPNLSIGQADVKAHVFVRFDFQYDK